MFVIIEIVIGISTNMPLLPLLCIIVTVIFLRHKCPSNNGNDNIDAMSDSWSKLYNLGNTNTVTKFIPIYTQMGWCYVGHSAYLCSWKHRISKFRPKNRALLSIANIYSCLPCHTTQHKRRGKRWGGVNELENNGLWLAVSGHCKWFIVLQISIQISGQK